MANVYVLSAMPRGYDEDVIGYYASKWAAEKAAQEQAVCVGLGRPLPDDFAFEPAYIGAHDFLCSTPEICGVTFSISIHELQGVPE